MEIRKARLQWEVHRHANNWKRLRAYLSPPFSSKAEAEAAFPALPEGYTRTVFPPKKDGRYYVRVNWGKNLPDDADEAVAQMMFWLNSIGITDVNYQPTLFDTPPTLFGIQPSLFEVNLVPVITRPAVKLSKEQKQRYAQLKGIVVKTGDGIQQVRRKAKPSRPRTDQKTDAAFILAVFDNEECCYGCDKKFGTHVFDPTSRSEFPYEKLAPEHSHVLVTRAEGIKAGIDTSAYDYPMCGVCQRKLGGLSGKTWNSLAEVGDWLKAEHAKAGYLYGIAKVSFEELH